MRSPSPLIKSYMNEYTMESVSKDEDTPDINKISMNREETVLHYVDDKYVDMI